MFIKIFGKDNCKYCQMAKDFCEDLAEREVISGYEYIDIVANGITKEDLQNVCDSPVKTVPQIFIDNKHVGGFTELKDTINASEILSTMVGKPVLAFAKRGEFDERSNN